MKAFTLVELLVVIFIITILLLLTGAYARAISYSRSTVCGSNLRQIGILTYQYIWDFHDFPSIADLSIEPELLCPQTPKSPYQTTQFYWSAHVTFDGLTQTKNPDEIPVVACGKHGRIKFGTLTGRIVGAIP